MGRTFRYQQMHFGKNIAGKLKSPSATHNPIPEPQMKCQRLQPFHSCHIILLATLVAFFPEVTFGVEPLKTPNVLLLLSDDLGYRDIGCYGGPVKTPTLDKLASKGMRFSQFYSGCAVCSPSRATLMTGRHHIRTGVYSWIHDPSQKSHLLCREVTLAEVLNDAGYATDIQFHVFD